MLPVLFANDRVTKSVTYQIKKKMWTIFLVINHKLANSLAVQPMCVPRIQTKIFNAWTTGRRQVITTLMLPRSCWPAGRPLPPTTQFSLATAFCSHGLRASSAPSANAMQPQATCDLSSLNTETRTHDAPGSCGSRQGLT